MYVRKAVKNVSSSPNAVVSPYKICKLRRGSALMQVAGRLPGDCLWRAVCLRDHNLTNNRFLSLLVRGCVIGSPFGDQCLFDEAGNKMIEDGRSLSLI